jgi:glycosyltransferase involved in cell wall biosynthesis
MSKLPSIIRNNQLEIIHSAGPLADQLLRIIGIKLPYVLTYHTTLWGQRRGIMASEASFKDLDPSEKVTLLLYPPLKFYESLSLARVKYIIAVSKSVRDELVTHYRYSGRINVIQNGIDTYIFRPEKSTSKDNRKRIIFSGRLIAWKGPQIVIRAIPQVLREHEETVFVFSGAGNRDPYVKMLQTMGIHKENYDFHYQDYGNMSQFYNSGDLLVLPSLLEGFPMAILEAMACGLPVVASDVGDVAELVRDGETGFLISRGDYRSLADKINKILSDEVLRKRMGENARNLITKNYSFERMGQRTLDVYNKLHERKI